MYLSTHTRFHLSFVVFYSDISECPWHRTNLRQILFKKTQQNRYPCNIKFCFVCCNFYLWSYILPVHFRKPSKSHIDTSSLFIYKLSLILLHLLFTSKTSLAMLFRFFLLISITKVHPPYLLADITKHRPCLLPSF